MVETWFLATDTTCKNELILYQTEQYYEVFSNDYRVLHALYVCQVHVWVLQ